MSAHPAKCAGCRGTGWMPGPPIIEVVEGRVHTYTTVTHCTHPWHRDDTGWDPYYDEPIAADEPRAIAAADRGYLEGQYDLWDMSGGKLGKPRPQRGVA